MTDNHDDAVDFIDEHPQTKVSIVHEGVTYNGTYFVEEGHVRATFKDQRGNIHSPYRAIGEGDPQRVAEDTLRDVVRISLR